MRNKSVLDYERLRCDYCGQYIGLDEFDDGTARRLLVQPDNEFGGEEYETYHLSCRFPCLGDCIHINERVICKSCGYDTNYKYVSKHESEDTDE